MKRNRITSELEGLAAQTRDNVVALARKGLSGLRDDLQFFSGIRQDMRTTGAIAPSSRHLARHMAGLVDVRLPGPVVELGPGTGVLTRGLLERGIAEERLVLVEYNSDFAQLLRGKFPAATIITGDAYQVARVLGEHGIAQPAAFVSGLPLFNQPLHRRVTLLNEALDMVHPQGVFVQFTYHVIAPVNEQHGPFLVEGSRRVWLNVPPARVWTYRKRVH